MKQIYKKLFFIAFIFLGLKTNAQCSSCTVTISGADAANHIISSGQTYCVTSSGSMSGLITISSGGTLCNQGNITSSNIWVAGGTLNNYGTINTNQVLVSNGGLFNNYVVGIANIDSLLITNYPSNFGNSGTLSGIRLTITNQAQASNVGNINVDYMRDSMSLPVFNYGNLIVNYDFGNDYNSAFLNFNYMQIARDFFNSTGSSVSSQCMISVGRDWYNSANIEAFSGACSGFNIAGISLNSGTIGTTATPPVDICDAGNPVGGVDGNSGTIAASTTFCSCTNNCVLVPVGLSEPIAQSSVLIQTLYPNPTSSNLTIELKNVEAEKLQIEVVDMMGRKQITNSLNATIGDNKTTIDVSKLAQGMYILSIVDSHKLSVKKMFSVVM